MQSDKEIIEEGRHSAAGMGMALLLMFQGIGGFLIGLLVGWFTWHR